MIHYGTLLQNATDIITKCDSYFITKCDKSLLQNASGFLLQNATVLLQNVTVITNCDDFITKCDSYYKMRRLSEIATVQSSWSFICKKQHGLLEIFLKNKCFWMLKTQSEVTYNDKSLKITSEEFSFTKVGGL